MKREVIGSYVVSNNTSINVYEIKYGIDDSVVVGYNNDSDVEECVIHYEDDEAYFYFGEMKIYMCEIMRV